MGRRAAGLLGELHMLRQREGLTLAKFERAPLVTAKLGATSPADAREKFESVLMGLGNGVKIRALRAAYGMGMSDPGILEDRRINYGLEVDRGIDAIKDWEDDALEELMVALEAGTASKVTRLHDPLSAPDQYNLKSMTIAVTVVDGKLLGTNSYSTFIHKHTGEHYELRRDDLGRKETKWQDMPLASRVLVGIPEQHSPEVWLSIAFDSGPTPKEVTVRRFASLNHLNIGEGVDLGAVQIDPAREGRSAEGNALLEESPPPGAIYELSWSEQPRLRAVETP